MRHHESAEQTVIIQWAGFYPALKWLLHVPNGGSRTKIEGARLKREGVKPGVSDLFLPLPVAPYAGLWIELKKRKQNGASKVSDKQKEFIRDMRAAGYKAVVCYGANDAIDVIKEYANI